ncbi:MAG: helix-turn-helix domain-containing protein [Clostridia bacterium]|nr:helix-turn-helix domain-containing protein [Clostridia bacterium]
MYHPIYEKLSLECKKRGISITALCAEITGSSGNLVTWKKGKIYSNDLLAIKDKLNISVDDILIGYNPSSSERLDTAIDFDSNIKLLKFPENLQNLLAEHEMTQQELANLLGTTQATVNRWLKGINEPDLSMLLEICLYLDETPNALLGYDDITEKQFSAYRQIRKTK